MVETVIALLMIVNNEIKEHRIQPSMSETVLKVRRIAMRSTKSGGNVRYECLKSEAELELYLGKKHIKKLILK